MHPERDDRPAEAEEKPITTSWRTGRPPKPRWPIRRIALLLIIAGAVVLVLLVTSDLHILVGLGRGSKSYANEWKSVFQELLDE
jgi:hypothetical protein